MGWDFTQGATKADIIRDVTKGWESGGSGLRVLAHAVRGSALYYVGESFYADGRATRRFIGVSLLGAERGYGWGRKDMDETMGPNEVSCPLAYLDIAPDPGGYATAWREQVRAYHAARARERALLDTLRPGARVRMAEGVRVGRTSLAGAEATVESARPLRLRVAGMLLRAQPRHVAEVLP